MHEMDCDVNARSLRAYAAAHGTEKMKGRSAHRTVATEIERLLAATRRVDDRVARLRLRYGHSELGRDLLEAGRATGMEKAKARICVAGYQQDPVEKEKEGVIDAPTATKQGSQVASQQRCTLRSGRHAYGFGSRATPVARKV